MDAPLRTPAPLQSPAPPRSSTSRSVSAPAIAAATGVAAPALALALALAACSPSDGVPDGDWWHPEPGLTFDYLIGAPARTTSMADVVVLDGEGAIGHDIDAAHRRGAHVVCYINAGAWEPYRLDAASFPEDLLGAAMDGWPDERWLDIRQSDQLIDLIQPRVQACAEGGFDAVDFDNVHGFTQETGFPLTAADQLAYNRALADLAHSHGLAAGLKNDLEQIPELVEAFDFAVNEECLHYGECEAYAPFVEAEKPVFNIEYVDSVDRCERATAAGLVSVYAPLALNIPGETCED